MVKGFSKYPLHFKNSNNKKRTIERRISRKEVAQDRREKPFIYPNETIEEAAKNLNMTKHELEERINNG